MPTIRLTAIIGAAAGLLATRFVKVDTDVPITVVLGMAGAAVCWRILRLPASVMGWVAMFAGAVIGAAPPIRALQMYGPHR